MGRRAALAAAGAAAAASATPASATVIFQTDFRKAAAEGSVAAAVEGWTCCGDSAAPPFSCDPSGSSLGPDPDQWIFGSNRYVTYPPAPDCAEYDECSLRPFGDGLLFTAVDADTPYLLSPPIDMAAYESVTLTIEGRVLGGGALYPECTARSLAPKLFDGTAREAAVGASSCDDPAGFEVGAVFSPVTRSVLDPATDALQPASEGSRGDTHPLSVSFTVDVSTVEGSGIVGVAHISDCYMMVTGMTIVANPDSNAANAGAVAAGVTVGVLLAALLGFYVFARRNRPELLVRLPKAMRPADSHRLHNQYPTPLSNFTFDPKDKDVGGVYQDPTVYEDTAALHRHIRECATIVPRESVALSDRLGSGEFGEVHRGVLLANGIEVECACKTIRPGSSPAENREFLAEAAIMGQFSHPNVVALLGVVLVGEPVVIIIELMGKGDLKQHLIANDGALDLQVLCNYSLGIARGMAYLAGMQFVHRDLAARNVLLNDEGAAKVADFGLSKEADSGSEYFRSEGGKVAIKWTAPEALSHGKYSTSSDVWAFGVTCWEVFAFGQPPYDGMANLAVITQVENGYRMPAPMNCPQSVHELMLGCWEFERRERLGFDEIVSRFEGYLVELEKTGTIANSVPEGTAPAPAVANDYADPQTDFTDTDGLPTRGMTGRAGIAPDAAREAAQNTLPAGDDYAVPQSAADTYTEPQDGVGQGSYAEPQAAGTRTTSPVPKPRQAAVVYTPEKEAAAASAATPSVDYAVPQKTPPQPAPRLPARSA